MNEGQAHTDNETNGGTSTTRRKQDIVNLKVLVPSVAVGAIIGKGGESIAKIQRETGARIKLSKVNDFYPGTDERVCLIQGTLEGVTGMHNYIMDRILEKPEYFESPTSVTSSSSTSTLTCSAETLPSTDKGVGSATSSHQTIVWTHGFENFNNRLPWGRHKQVKILVPNCTAGLVIGKLGSYIREIKDRTGAFIQISQKSVDINLLERCITIAGEPDQCRAAVDLVLAKIADDPQSSIYPTISYSQLRGPIASAYPTGSPFAFTPPTLPAATFHLQSTTGLPRFNVHPNIWATQTTTSINTSSNFSSQTKSKVNLINQPFNFSPLFNPYDQNSSSIVQAAAIFQAATLAANLNRTNYYSAYSADTNAAVASSTAMTNSTTTTPLTQQYLYTVDNSPLVYQNVDTTFSREYQPTSVTSSPKWPSDQHLINSTAYNATYQHSGPLNFAFFPSDQSFLAAVASRQFPDTSYSNAAFFTPSGMYGSAAYSSNPSYAANLNSNLERQSTGTNETVPVHSLATVNPAFNFPDLGLNATAQFGTTFYHPGLSPPALNLTPTYPNNFGADSILSKFQFPDSNSLNDLFQNSLQLNYNNRVADEHNTGLNTASQFHQQTFAQPGAPALSSHPTGFLPAMLGGSGAYSFVLSPPIATPLTTSTISTPSTTTAITTTSQSASVLGGVKIDQASEISAIVTEVRNCNCGSTSTSTSVTASIPIEKHIHDTHDEFCDTTLSSNQNISTTMPTAVITTVLSLSSCYESTSSLTSNPSSCLDPSVVSSPTSSCSRGDLVEQLQTKDHVVTCAISPKSYDYDLQTPSTSPSFGLCTCTSSLLCSENYAFVNKQTNKLSANDENSRPAVVQSDNE